MPAVTSEARDALPLFSYSGLPTHADPDGDGTADRRAPMVLYVTAVHGLATAAFPAPPGRRDR